MKITLAGCVIADDYDRLLLLHHNTDEKHEWELPGGKVKSHEEPTQAVVRELYEELGVNARLIKQLGSADFEDDEHEYHYVWFQAQIVSGDPEIHEPHLFDDLDYVEFDDLASLALSPNMEILLMHLVSGEVTLS